MIAVLSLTLLGFFLGMRHATDPDHVIAVSTIVTRQPTIRGALLIGSLWGVGHTLTIVAVGGAIVLFTVVIPPRLGLSMEMAVALMLIVLGMWNLTGFLEQIRGLRPLSLGSAGRIHGHLHRHGDYVHSHPSALGSEQHGHDEHRPVTWLDRRLGGLGFYQVLRPLLIGLVHGLAGSAAVALLVLALIKNPWWAMAYLVVFGIGTIAGMG
jgi:ABC-type nickel/cobalt efflux system permease component RcnA